MEGNREKSKRNKERWKKKQQLNKMGERLKPVRWLIDKGCFRLRLFLKVWCFDVNVCERQMEDERDGIDTSVCSMSFCVDCVVLL